MLINADVKSLEVVTCAYLSNDEVLKQEVREGIDFHELNKQRFNLPDRVTAKRFKFKLIYGASAYGYANDPDFLDVSTNERYWQSVIDEYYAKYQGIARWHREIVQSAMATGIYRSPTGREYSYPQRDVVKKIWYWRPKILNYPVQGLGADLVSLARVTLWNRLQKINDLNSLLVSSVHDSIVVDSPEESWYNISIVMKESIKDVPKNFERMFGKVFDLPLNAEIKAGPNLGEMTIVDYN